ncbi:Ppx/GppA phosphatase family protein [Megasphaera vaginalis (ex Bordigoni et al. 2020)]|uniref:Ppx/GppA phosphatase family protein n=1 Tax=Megasphaera vaginalis (ex Bordigoni et al. 2020) TaxID=2045301 RepID=UPI000C7CD587|nr:Ppx/GppA phosphatase family protein [Megasphaera vaginalis (ex Bordigoni et al. 2020)]
MEKIAIIDLGSNSIRFVVIEIKDNRSYSLLYQEKESIRLGHGLMQTGELSNAGMDRAMTCLAVYRHLISVMEIDTTIAVATAAVRSAKNGEAFLQRVRTQTGIEMKIISGEREAYLGYLGVINTIDIKDCILFDFGGASVEFTLVRNGKQEHSLSVPIGAVTLTEKFGLQGTVSGEMLEKCLTCIRKKLSDIPWLAHARLPLVGVGGTARAIAKMDQRTTNYELPTLHNYVVGKDNFDAIYALVTERTYVNRKKIPGLSSERADLIVAGVAAISAIFTLTESDRLIVSGCGLREGLFFEHYAGLYHLPSPYIENILSFSIANVIGNLDPVNSKHVDQVEKVSLLLFDKLSFLHGYGPRERQLLATAAKLHDIGKIINYYSHARHSAFMIGHAPLYGLTQTEQLVASFIAGFHHGISRKIMRAYRYVHIPSEEEWRMIRKVSTFLALAEASDTTYEQIIKDITVESADTVIVLVLETYPGSSHEAVNYEMQQLKKQFKREFDTSLLFVWK